MSILKRSAKEPYTYYTHDGLFKVTRCAVRAYGWDVCVRRENGTYRAEAGAATLNEARKMVIERGGIRVRAERYGNEAGK